MWVLADVYEPDVPRVKRGQTVRVMARYPQGPAFTNEPGVSSNVVGRDAAWFVYGNDHFRPAFSRALLDTFARLQYPNLTLVSPDGRVLPYPKPLTISRHTVKEYLSNAMRKLGVDGRVAAVVEANRRGLLDPSGLSKAS